MKEKHTWLVEYKHVLAKAKEIQAQNPPEGYSFKKSYNYIESGHQNRHPQKKENRNTY